MTLNKKLEDKLNVFRGNSVALKAVYDAIELLDRSGIRSFLIEKGRPNLITLGDIGTMSLQGTYSSGYFDCLEDIFQFRELIEAKPAQEKTPTISYGGKGIALARGDLTKEDLK